MLRECCVSAACVLRVCYVCAACVLRVCCVCAACCCVDGHTFNCRQDEIIVLVGPHYVHYDTVLGVMGWFQKATKAFGIIKHPISR